MKTINIISGFKGLVLVGALLASSSLMADAELYKKCAGCHGVHAEKSAMGKSKVIKDLSATEIVTALKGYKEGTYGGSMKGLMKGQVRTLNDEQIESLAKTISAMK
jgi:cytochrome c553